MTLVLNEADFERQILDLAAICGWRTAHFRPAKTERGWRTPVSGQGQGFPDLVMVRGDRLIFAELKSERGVLSLDQAEWLDAFSGVANAAVPTIDVRVWRPAMWERIVEQLRREP